MPTLGMCFSEPFGLSIVHSTSAQDKRLPHSHASYPNRQVANWLDYPVSISVFPHRLLHADAADRPCLLRNIEPDVAEFFFLAAFGGPDRRRACCYRLARPSSRSSRQTSVVSRGPQSDRIDHGVFQFAGPCRRWLDSYCSLGNHAFQPSQLCSCLSPPFLARQRTDVRNPPCPKCFSIAAYSSQLSAVSPYLLDHPLRKMQIVLTFPARSDRIQSCPNRNS